jgi:predicted kinase
LALKVQSKDIMPKCYQLIGVPGSGKTTWLQNQIWALGLTVVSTDTFVEAYAAAQGRTYNQVFEDYMPTAVDLMVQQVAFAHEHGHTVIWDQTSVTVASRRKKFRMLPNYQHIAVVFRTPEPAELAGRLASRPGKIIPEEIVQDMINRFEMPTLEEGFQEIWHV